MAEETRRSKPTGYYKIGSTTDPDQRIRNLRTGNPRNLNYICKIRVSNKTKAEQAAKKELKEYHVEDNPDGGTEWYEVRKSELKSFERKFKRAVDKYKI